MNWHKLQGKFIVLDGPDGCGKSTQTGLLADKCWVAEVTPVVLRDPGGTAIGERIRDILLDPIHDEMSIRTETLLYMASRAQLFDQHIAPALEDGDCVICDRWISSTYAYQAVAGKIGPDIVLDLAEIALKRTWPDITIIIDVPSDYAFERLNRNLDRMEAKGLEFHKAVRQAFLELAGRRDDFAVVDGSATIEEVHNQIIEVLARYVNA